MENYPPPSKSEVLSPANEGNADQVLGIPHPDELISPVMLSQAPLPPPHIPPVQPYGQPNAVPSDIYLYQAFVEGPKGKTASPNMVRALATGDFRFSVLAFFFGVAYFAYRRCLIETLVIFLIVIVSAFIPFELFGSSWVLGAAYGCAFYPLYRHHAKTAVEQAKREGADVAAIQRLREEGGTSPVALGVVIALYAIIVGLYVAIALSAA